MILKLRAWDTDMGHITYADEPEEQGKREYRPYEFGMKNSYWNKATLSIMTCTGLLDRNGDLVYEGDIVTNDLGDYQEVFWNRKSAGFLKRPWEPEDLTDNFITSLRDLKGWRVVGNIYDPPEQE